MDTRKIEKFLKTFGLHILMVLAGLILLVNPDGATALVTKIVGWLFVICGAVKLVVPAVSKQPIHTGDWVVGGVLIVAGVILLAKPLILANLIGRVLGILLLIEGIRNLRSGGFGLVTVLTIVAGVVLIIMPRTLTQTVLAICGIVLIVIGVMNIVGRMNSFCWKRLNEAGDPNIIDAEK